MYLGILTLHSALCLLERCTVLSYSTQHRPQRLRTGDQDRTGWACCIQLDNPHLIAHEEVCLRERTGRQCGSQAVPAGKPSIVEQLNEFIQELKDIDTSIAAHVRPPPPPPPSQGLQKRSVVSVLLPCRDWHAVYVSVYQRMVCLQWPDQIHANDSILTFGYSETVLVFLLEAAKKLDFQVHPLSNLKIALQQRHSRRWSLTTPYSTGIRSTQLMCFEWPCNRHIPGKLFNKPPGGQSARTQTFVLAARS